MIRLLRNFGYYILSGGKGWLGFPDLWSGQKSWCNLYLIPVVNVDEVRRAQLAKFTLPTSMLVPLESLRSFKVCSDAKERVGCGKLPHLSIPSKTAVRVPEFTVEDLPLSRTAAWVPEFAVKDLPLGIILMMMMMMMILKKYQNITWVIIKWYNNL